jgi:hypothetical protein
VPVLKTSNTDSTSEYKESIVSMYLHIWVWVVYYPLLFISKLKKIKESVKKDFDRMNSYPSQDSPESERMGRKD